MGMHIMCKNNHLMSHNDALCKACGEPPGWLDMERVYIDKQQAEALQAHRDKHKNYITVQEILDNLNR